MMANARKPDWWIAGPSEPKIHPDSSNSLDSLTAQEGIEARSALRDADWANAERIPINRTVQSRIVRPRPLVDAIVTVLGPSPSVYSDGGSAVVQMAD